MHPPNIRRGPRHQVELPVRIATTADGSKVYVPAMATDISRRGMAVYGGVQLQPGDLMEVEFQTPNHVCVAGVVRNRTGYCFGLEFVTLVKANGAAAENKLEDLFIRRHASYLHQRQVEIKRLRQKVAKIRQLRKEIETLAGRGAFVR